MSAFTFGTPTVTSSSSNFTLDTQKPATGFGTPSFGSPAPVSSELTFGTTTSTPTTTTGINFGFGVTPTTSTQTQSGGMLLGSNTTAATTTTSSFPTLATKTPLFTGLNLGASATNTASVKTPLITTPATGTLPQFGTTTSTPSLFGSVIGGGLLGAKPTTATDASTTTTSITAATTNNKGLGGLDVSLSNIGLSQGSSNPTAAKENLLPSELMQTIEKFKEFVKARKVLSSDIARGSARPLNRCAEDTASLMEILTTLAGSVQRDRSSADKLKQDTAKALQNAEIAQRTHDTPPGLQYENSAPLLFFLELAENFEHDLMLFRSQIETTEKHIQTMMTPKTLTPKELTMAMNKLHESLIAVAGKLQGVHSKVQQQKEQYLNFRKYVLKDNTNVFGDITSNCKSSRSNIGKITSGPTPFVPGNKSFLSTTALSSNQSTSYDTRNPLVWGKSASVSSGINATVPSVKPPTVSLNFNTPANLTAPLSINESDSSFQLQKPPVGNKRGKH